MKRTTLLVILFCVSTWVGAQKMTVSVLGDSYSTFDGYLTPSENAIWYFADQFLDRTDVRDVRQTWWHQLITQRGWQLCVNNSYSGSTICNTGYGGADYSDRSFLTRMPHLGCPDIILIFGATNDSWAKAPIGEFKYDHFSKDDLKAFRPAMARMLEWMTNRYINTRIYFILNNELSADVTSSAKTICQHYGVECIELRSIDKQSGHPSVKGMRQIAEQVSTAIK